MSSLNFMLASFMSERMWPTERRATAALAGIFASRMLGLFMVLPVLALHAENIPSATPFLIGMVLGAYGLTQSLLQLPLGYWSDRVGRKKVLQWGLGVFILGSIVAGLSNDIYTLIVGRALQGAGAVGATLLALLSDATRPAVRTRAMAVVGITIGASFALAFLIAPFLDNQFGLSGIFWLTAILGMLSWAVVTWGMPVPEQAFRRITTNPIKLVLRDSWLSRLSIGIALLHASLTALFLTLPLALQAQTGWETQELWKCYLPIFFLALCGLGPLLRIAHPLAHAKSVLIVAVLCLILSEVLMGFSAPLWRLCLGMLIFFTVFNMLEAMLPSLVSRVVPATDKGAALGVYSTAQFFGIFMGGVTGGALHQIYGPAGVIYGCIAFALLWLISLYSWKTNLGGSYGQSRN